MPEDEVEVSGDVVFGEQPTAEPEAQVEGKPAEAQVDDGLEAAFGLPEVKALLEEAQAAGKPVQLTPEQIRGLPMEARALLANVARRAQQEAAAGQKAREDFAKQKEQVRLLERQARMDRAALGKLGSADTVKAWLAELEAKAKAPADADPYSPEAIEAQVNARAAQLFTSFFSKLEEVGANEKAAVERAEAEQRDLAEREAAQTYIDQHRDDFDDEAQGVDIDGKPAPMIEVMKDFVKLGKSIPQAHRMAVALRDRAVLEATNRGAVEDLRRRNQPSVRRQQQLPPRPPVEDTEALLAYYERHPEARKRDADPATWRT